MNRKVNSFNPKFIRELTKCIDEIESNHGETALVTVGLN
jgi:enoyl-CoA hydratase/carnithine racemase